MGINSGKISLSEQYQLTIAGDVFLRSRSDKKPFVKAIQSIFRQADIKLFNLETPITSSNYHKEKAVPLRTEPKQANLLGDMGQNVVVNLANNHTLDYGLVGLQDTLRYLQASEIGYVGIIQGTSSQMPHFVELSCGRVAMLGYTEGGEVNQDIGVAALDQVQIIDDIRRIRTEGADWVIVCLHWGIEYTSYPSPTQQRIARALVESGADVIAGSHPHMVQGVEHYQRGVIFYSLGNFNFHTHFDEDFPQTDWGMIALVKLNDKGVDYDVLPVIVNSDFQPELMSDNEQMKFRSHLTNISTCLFPSIPRFFWLSHASEPFFRNNLRGWRIRIKQYGVSHFLAMIKWLVHPRIYPYYLGLILRVLTLHFNNFIKPIENESAQR